MTPLEKIDYRLSYLLSLYEERKNDPSYKVQLALLVSKKHRILARLRPEQKHKKELIES